MTILKKIRKIKHLRNAKYRQSNIWFQLKFDVEEKKKVEEEENKKKNDLMKF